MKTWQNEFGGKSLWVAPGENTAEIPEEFRRFAFEPYLNAVHNAREILEPLYTKSELGGPAALLEEAASFGGCGLQIHFADVFGTLQYEVTLRGFFRGGSAAIDFRLPSESWQYDFLPQTLKHLYAVCNGTADADWPMTGGIPPLDQTGIVDTMLDEAHPWISSSSLWYRTEDGDCLLTRDELAVWWLHGSGHLYETGIPLADAIDDYCFSRLNDDIWSLDRLRNERYNTGF